MNFEEIVNHRRSIRDYKDEPIDSQKIKHCLELASLSPNSSNMQLWEFLHIENPDTLQQLSQACFNQMTAKTAQQMVVFVTRRDLYAQRAKDVLALEVENVQENSPQEKQARRIKRAQKYYGQSIPFLYAHFFGLVGLVRVCIAQIVGLFRPMYREVSESDTKVVVHKSCALAAQTFMLAMASKGYDTCPMEGFDSRKVKKILKIPFGADVNMIISCGIRKPEGVFGDRKRIPFDKIYRKV